MKKKKRLPSLDDLLTGRVRRKKQVEDETPIIVEDFKRMLENRDSIQDLIEEIIKKKTKEDDEEDIQAHMNTMEEEYEEENGVPVKYRIKKVEAATPEDEEEMVDEDVEDEVEEVTEKKKKKNKKKKSKKGVSGDLMGRVFNEL